MDVGAWLRSLGLEQYEGMFRESEIEADVLPELTESDLEKLGLPLGPRKRVLKAIANLGNSDRASGTASFGRPAAEDAAERRQLTVMFCDLAGGPEMGVAQLKDVVISFSEEDEPPELATARQILSESFA